MMGMKRSMEAFLCLIVCVFLQGTAWGMDIWTLLDAAACHPAIEIHSDIAGRKSWPLY